MNYKNHHMGWQKRKFYYQPIYSINLREINQLPDNFDMINHSPLILGNYNSLYKTQRADL